MENTAPEPDEVAADDDDDDDDDELAERRTSSTLSTNASSTGLSDEWLLKRNGVVCGEGGRAVFDPISAASNGGGMRILPYSSSIRDR